MMHYVEFHFFLVSFLVFGILPASHTLINTSFFRLGRIFPMIFLENIFYAFDLGLTSSLYLCHLKAWSCHSIPDLLDFCALVFYIFNFFIDWPLHFISLVFNTQDSLFPVLYSILDSYFWGFIFYSLNF